ncbi:hypothetical protein FCULG_00005437 [Fusarium culmorum]|uniref:Uncharacterized protein n=1 Tax=Fusarium culmorum TaxID=5516 RepID=A0A2T4GUK9_FUSCU|nr:hypothetical protein FCULG_00005437 [Fusarium culmorum]
MDSPDDAPYFCMADTRRRLCHFDLKENDRVIAHIGDRRCSIAFNLRMTDTIHDRYEWINLHTCARLRCMMDSPRVPFFHRDCYRFRLYHISSALVAAGNYTFDSPGHEENRRSHRIKRLLVPKLRDQLQIRLPDEILVFIAVHLVLAGADVSETTASLTQDVYISYTLVDGVRYVKSIDNAVPKLCEQDRPRLLSNQGEPIRKICIAEDYRGIRAVKLCSADALFTGPTPIEIMVESHLCSILMQVPSTKVEFHVNVKSGYQVERHSYMR